MESWQHLWMDGGGEEICEEAKVFVNLPRGLAFYLSKHSTRKHQFSHRSRPHFFVSFFLSLDGSFKIPVGENLDLA